MISFNNIGSLGRLGNQMFQYAAIRGIAEKKGYDWVIPPPLNPAPDNYGLFDVFKMTNCTVDNYGYGNNTTSMPGFHYDKEYIRNLSDNSDIIGFFQTEKYFKHIEDLIREDFTFKNEVLNPAKNFVNLIKEKTGSSPIFLHVRRGDINLVGRRGERWSYQAQPDHHPVCEPEYYLRALEHFDPKRPIIVVSDVIEWCKGQEWLQGERFYFSDASLQTFDDGAAIPDIDLAIMSLCDDAIIANSSLSWWGAWLINNPNKTIVAPKKWFGPAYAHYDMSDIRPEDWIQL
jgi:hypothetical protein